MAAIAYLAKTHHERRRVTRTVLYHLLELHHVVSRTALCLKSLEGVLITAVRQDMEARNETYDEKQGLAAMDAARPELLKFAMAQLDGLSVEMADSYSKALSDLARENPVLAFELRGRDKAVVLISTVRDFMQSSTDQPAPSDKDLPLFNHFFLQLSEEDLHQAIIKTAWRCDIITHGKVLMHLRTSRNQDFSEDGGNLIQRLVEEMTSAHSPLTTAMK